MESMKPDFDLHIQKSFSFTAFSKFKESTLEFFSDDYDYVDDDEDENDNNIHRNDDNNSFIEISLDNPTNDTNNNVVNSNNNNSHLRISFSSSFPSIPESRPDPPALAPSLRSSSTGGGGAFRVPPESFEGSRRRDGHGGQVPPGFTPLLHPLLFSLEAHSSPAPAPVCFDGGDRSDWKGTNRPLQLAMINNNSDINIHRKSSNITTPPPPQPTITKTSGGNRNGIISKWLTIKYRATKVKKLLSSLFTKSRGQVNICNSDRIGNDISRANKRPIRQQTLENDTKTPSHHSGGSGYKPRALEVNLGAVRGVLEAVNTTRASRRKTSSCPSSIKSSPIHGQGFATDCSNNNGTFFSAENSILAAIAHCKSSLGQSTDFRF